MNLNFSQNNTTGILTFDRQDSSANIFDYQVLCELSTHLDAIAKNLQLKSLIITSAKPSIFIAGADIKALANSNREEMADLINLGQNTFNKLSNLPITTVAAIHGACVGGGYELALACDYRVASNASCTNIGLPETQLGILPAWGGSTRLPALIGLPKALPLILNGTLLKAMAAMKKGLIDGICPVEQLPEYALEFAALPKRSTPLHLLAHNPLSVAIIRKKAYEDLFKKTRGQYPALTAALKVACDGVRISFGDSLKNELETVLTLGTGPEAKQLIQLFFLTEKSKKLRPNTAAPRPLTQTAVIGSGVMGSGIAYWLSTRSRHVILKDISHESMAAGMERIENLYAQSVAKRILTSTEAQDALDHIQPTIQPVPMHDLDIIIEAATEDLELKKKIFASLSELSGPDTILATNTSALPVHELAKSIQYPERLVGLHFFNPVPRMKLVEVVETPQTSPETLASAVAFVQSIGKLPVVVKDSPGFVVNRILLPYLVHAGELFTGSADMSLIDNAMLKFGMPMGPLRLLDEVGLDVSLHVAKTLAAAFPDRMSVPKILENLVSQGMLGRKSGAGFYNYGKSGCQPNSVARSFVDSTHASTLSGAEIQRQLVELMSKEAAMCLDEGIADSAASIDFAMVMGTGYAPFRGGPLRYAHHTQILNRNFY